MGKDGSKPGSPPPLFAAVALLAMAGGLVAMKAVAGHAPFVGLGLRSFLVLSELALAAPAVAILLARQDLRGSVLGDIRGGVRPFLASAAAGVTLWALSLGLFELQYSVWRPPPGYLEVFRFLHERLRPSGPLDALVSLAAIAAVPALCEELVFRGLALQSLVVWLGHAGASLASATLFGLIHLDRTLYGELSFYRVPFAIAVGLGFAALRLASRSLLPPFVAHATLNAITFAAAPFTDDPAAGLPEPRPLLGAALFVLGLGLSLVPLRALRPR